MIAASNIELHRAIEAALGNHCRIADLARRPFPYQTSFPLEELDVRLTDGTRLSLLVKDLSWDALAPGVKLAKPAFLYDPLREILIYRDVLASAELGTARYYAGRVDARAGRYTLVIERVQGTELYQVGDLALWQEAARWLAELHSRFAGPHHPTVLPLANHLLRHDADYFRAWMERALAFVGTRETAPPTRAKLRHLAGGYEAVIQRLLALPVSLIHGEFFASNVLIRPSGQGGRVCPVDWEMAGLGPGLIDLAALVAGNWEDSARAAMAQAYYDAMRARGHYSFALNEMTEALQLCRLHLAVQRLGWARDWAPPREHARDWLGETLHLAEALELI